MQQQALADSLVKEVSTSRDNAPHAGAQAREVDPALIDAVAQAPDDWACRHAIVRMLDSLGDQHFDMELPATIEVARPTNLALCAVEGRTWADLDGALNWSGSAWRAVTATPLDPSRETWARIESIDGYAPRTPAAARALLLGAPGTTVRLRVTTLDGLVGECELLREVPEKEVDRGLNRHMDMLLRLVSTNTQIAAAWTIAGGPPTELATWPPITRRLGPGGSVGYLRVQSFGDAGGSDHAGGGGASHSAARRTLRAAMDSVSDCETIILDLTENRGGCPCMPHELLQRFLPPMANGLPFRMDVEASQLLPGACLAWKAPLDDSVERFGGRLIVIVDDMTCSAAEVLVESLRGAPNVTIIGAPTCGAGFAVVNLEVSRPPMTLRLGGRPIEWTPPHSSPEAAPIQPDVLVPIDPAALAYYGPIGAIARRRFEMLAAAWRAAGLEAPSLLPVPQPLPKRIAFPGTRPWWTLIAPDSVPAPTPAPPSP